jgi:hypothetical protein
MQPDSELPRRKAAACGFADGHGQLMSQPPEGFEQWEKEHMAPPPANQ